MKVCTSQLWGNTLNYGVCLGNKRGVASARRSATPPESFGGLHIGALPELLGY
jgi:hypothetical protein